MSGFAVPRPLGERWLAAASPGRLEPADLAERIARWRRREDAFARWAPVALEGPGPLPTPAARAAVEAWLPLEDVARDVRAVLRARFQGALAARAPGWDFGLLARSGTWLDLKRAMRSLARVTFPSELLERLDADRDAAEAFVFELAAPVAHGDRLDRYPETLARIAATAPRSVRAWDAGCGTGEGTFSLARALREGRDTVEVVGTTPCPFEREMAERRGRPHDRARTLALREAAAGLAVEFRQGDLLDPAQAPRDQDVVLAAGVLGGVLATEAQVLAALRSIAAALAPAGRAFVADRFRADRHARAAALVETLAPRAGLRLDGAGELVHLGPSPRSP